MPTMKHVTFMMMFGFILFSGCSFELFPEQRVKGSQEKLLFKANYSTCLFNCPFRPLIPGEKASIEFQVDGDRTDLSVVSSQEDYVKLGEVVTSYSCAAYLPKKDVLTKDARFEQKGTQGNLMVGTLDTKDRADIVYCGGNIKTIYEAKVDALRGGEVHLEVREKDGSLIDSLMVTVEKDKNVHLSYGDKNIELHRDETPTIRIKQGERTDMKLSFDDDGSFKSFDSVCHVAISSEEVGYFEENKSFLVKKKTTKARLQTSILLGTPPEFVANQKGETTLTISCPNFKSKVHLVIE